MRKPLRGMRWEKLRWEIKAGRIRNNVDRPVTPTTMQIVSPPS